jgi:hypothetical protein
MTEALKGGVYRCPTPLARMSVAPVRVALPDLDTHISDRPAIHIPDMAAEIGDFPTGSTLLAAHPGEIVIVVQWQFDRIKGTGRLPRRRCQQISRQACAADGQAGHRSQQLSFRWIVIHEVVSAPVSRYWLDQRL